MKCLLRIATAILIVVGAVSKSNAQKTAILFGATGTVGSEILTSLLNNNSGSGDGGYFFEEVILIGRRSSRKLDDILLSSKEKKSTPNVTSVVLANLAADLESYDQIKSADACFIAIGVGDINKLSLPDWHAVEVDLIASVARYCNKVGVSSITLLSAVDVDYESAVPYSEGELGLDSVSKEGEEKASNKKPLGWIRSVYHYYRMMGLKERAIIESAKVGNIRIFQPSTIRTESSRYGMVDKVIFAIHNIVDPFMRTSKYHSVDVKLLGMAMVLDAKNLIKGQGGDRGQQQEQQEQHIAKLTYADYLDIAGEAFKARYGQTKDEL